jgi:integrase
MNKCRTCALEINAVAHELTRGRVAKINPKRIPIFHDAPQEQIILTPAQMRRMIELEPEHAALIAVYGFLGLRMSEGIALDETSLLPNGVLAVRMQADRHTGSVKTELKNRNSRRTILLPEPILEILRPLSFGGPILRNKDGKAHKHRALHALIGRIGRRHGIPNLSAHDFRHSLLTWLDENGAPRSTKLAIAGHSRIKVEDRYNHASEESKRDWILKAWEAGVVSAYDKPETKTATEAAI